MKYLIVFLCLIQGLVCASDFKIDKSHSTVDFEVTHLVISKVRGTFNQFSGEIVWDQTNLKESYFHGEVTVDSIDTNNNTRDKHLKGADFFDYKLYPTLAIKTKKIKKTGKKNVYKIVSDLTMKDVTKQVESLLVVKGPIKDSRGNNRFAFETEFSINRFDYNLNWNSLIETGELVVAEDVVIDIKIQGIEIK